MTRDEILRRLSARRDDLRKRFGVSQISLFGSTAREERRDTSDVDILVEFARPVTLFDLGALHNDLVTLLGCPVDLVLRDSILPALRDDILREAIDVQ